MSLDPVVAKIRDTIPDFVVHGIKHLVRTKLGELRVPPHVKKQMLDHVAGSGMDLVYDHHDYQPEVAAAFELWADHVEKLVAAEGVCSKRQLPL